MATITGTSGADRLKGTAAADAITGRGGADTLTGGGGADAFAYTAPSDSTGAAKDTILDFGGSDVLDLSALSAVTRWAGIGPARADRAFAAWETPTRSAVKVDATGDGVEDMTIALCGSPVLSEANLRLAGDGGGGGGGGTPGFRLVGHETFDGGAGLFSRHWGQVDFSVPGQVTVWARASAGFGHEADGGIMVPPTGARAGFGHGRYEFTLGFGEDLATGGYALLWPATDVWPGPELDVVELNLQGQPYSALHWADENGDNQYAPHPLRGFDPAGVHTYAMEWMPDHISVFVDGVLQYRETSPEVLAKDFARGGQNAAPGMGMQTFWAQQVQDGDNAITLYDFKYLAPDGIA